jgi:4-hydroxybenzoate polyprenyltransferase
MGAERRGVRVAAWLELARVSNLPTVWSNVLAAWLVSGAGVSAGMVLVMVGGSFVYAGGCTLNDAFDERWDREHRPGRLIPSGRVTARFVWVSGLVEMMSGVVLMAMGSGWPGVWYPVALAVAVLVYDARHKETPWSVVVMGSCRWLLWVSAGSAALGGTAVPEAAMVWGAVVWGYVVILSLVARGEATRGEEVPATRRLLWLVPAVLMAVGWVRVGGWVPGVCGALAALMGAWLLRPRAGVDGRVPGVGEWVSRMLAFLPVLDLGVVVASGGSWGFSGVFGVLSVVALGMQRRFAAT